MPPRVTFWTGTWDPRREAISKELASLRRFNSWRAPVVSFSSGQRSRLIPRHGVVQMSANQWVPLRIAAALIERWGDVTHVFGSLESWHLLRALGRRPIVLTVAVPGRSGDSRLLNKVERFVVETNALANEVAANGVDPSRIEVVYPGIDLNAFKPATLSASRFRILFASSPADPGEFEARGIPLLIETARRCPDVEFVFLWRRWGNEAAATVALNALQPPPNVTLNHVDVRDMAAVYNTVHAVACCYAAGFGKSAPNSVIEGLACGRPALVSTACGLADVLEENGAGAVAARDPESLAEAVRELGHRYAERSQAARRLAERLFDIGQFCGRYSALYQQYAGRPPAVREGEPDGTFERNAEDG